MDKNTGSTQTPRNLDVPSASASGLDLDPDPLVDDIDVLHSTTEAATGNLIEQLLSRVMNAARQAVETILSKFASSDPDADPIINISKPRYLRRNEDNLTKEMKKANDAARENNYAKLFKGEPVQVVPANSKSQLPDTTSSSPEQVSETVEVKPVEVSVGEKTFQQFFTLFQDKEGDLPFSPGYFAFTPECLSFANDLAKTAIGKSVDKMPNKAEIKAAKALLEGERTIRHAQEQEAAHAVREQEKLAKLEAQKTKLPGQSDFEEFFAMYHQHVLDNTPLVIVERSKFLSDACMSYAASFLSNPEFPEQDRAALYLSMWRANPVAAMDQARSAAGFQMPPPPGIARRRQVGAEVPVTPPAWEPAANALSAIPDADRIRLATVFQLKLAELDQAFDGLRIAATLPSTRVKANDIDALEQAKLLLEKSRLPGLAEQLKAYPQLHAVLASRQRISQLIDDQLQLLLPEPARGNVLAPLVLPELSSLSEEEAARAAEDFDAFVEAFMTALEKGRNYKLAAGSKYLSPACVAIANNFAESISKAQGLQLLDADRNRLLAASFLLREASKLANTGTNANKQ
jgi:hypothetical protein